MATSPGYMKFIADQMQGAGNITYRKMFGDYGVYCNGKLFALVCDDQLFIKITDAGRSFCPELKAAPPYDGAKPCFLIENVDDRAYLTKLVTATCEALPEPKPRKPKGRKNNGI